MCNCKDESKAGECPCKRRRRRIMWGIALVVIAAGATYFYFRKKGELPG